VRTGRRAGLDRRRCRPSWRAASVGDRPRPPAALCAARRRRGTCVRDEEARAAATRRDRRRSAPAPIRQGGPGQVSRSGSGKDGPGPARPVPVREGRPGSRPGTGLAPPPVGSRPGSGAGDGAARVVVLWWSRFLHRPCGLRRLRSRNRRPRGQGVQRPDKKAAGPIWSPRRWSLVSTGRPCRVERRPRSGCRPRCRPRCRDAAAGQAGAGWSLGPGQPRGRRRHPLEPVPVGTKRSDRKGPAHTDGHGMIVCIRYANFSCL